jgi:antitoxin (DNA-binding transcriptional repressor) of toxin-antitoxin stability system
MVYVDELTVSEARARLPEILDRIERGEEIMITRHGRAAAVLVRPDALRPRRNEAVFAQAREIHRMLEEARRQPLGPPTMDPAYAEELIREIRAGRDGD